VSEITLRRVSGVGAPYVATIKGGRVVDITVAGVGYTKSPDLMIEYSYDDDDLPDVPLSERGFGV
jgi:hypothetical protein